MRSETGIARRWAIAIMAGLLLLGSGCRSDDDYPPPPRGKSAAKSGKRTSGKNRKSRRDPVDDMFFGVGKKANTPDVAADGLSDEQRDIVKKNRKWQDDEMSELRSRHDRFNEERKARKRWVYSLKSDD